MQEGSVRGRIRHDFRALARDEDRAEELRLMKELAQAEEELKQAEESLVGRPVIITPGKDLSKSQSGHFTPDGKEKYTEPRRNATTSDGAITTPVGLDLSIK